MQSLAQVQLELQIAEGEAEGGAGNYTDFPLKAGVLASASGPLSASEQATSFLYCVRANVVFVFMNLMGPLPVRGIRILMQD